MSAIKFEMCYSLQLIILGKIHGSSLNIRSSVKTASFPAIYVLNFPTLLHQVCLIYDTKYIHICTIKFDFLKKTHLIFQNSSFSFNQKYTHVDHVKNRVNCTFNVVAFCKQDHCIHLGPFQLQTPLCLLEYASCTGV